MLKGFRKIAASVGTSAWLKRGLEPPGKTTLEDCADEAYQNLYADSGCGPRDYAMWSSRRQGYYAQAVIRNACAARAAHDARFELYKERATSEWQLMEERQITTEEIVEAKLGFEKTLTEIEMLSDETRFCLMLNAAGVDVEHIARLLFITPSSVRHRIERGRDRLREVVAR